MEALSYDYALWNYDFNAKTQRFLGAKGILQGIEQSPNNDRDGYYRENDFFSAALPLCDFALNRY